MVSVHHFTQPQRQGHECAPLIIHFVVSHALSIPHLNQRGVREEKLDSYSIYIDPLR